MLDDPQVRAAYEDLDEEYGLIAEMIKARKIAHQTQKEVARKMQTPASVIARLESGFDKNRHSPTIKTLRRYAKAIGCKLSIKLVPLEIVEG